MRAGSRTPSALCFLRPFEIMVGMKTLDRALIGWFVMSLVVGCFVDSEIVHVDPVLFASGEVRLSGLVHVLLGVAFTRVCVYPSQQTPAWPPSPFIKASHWWGRYADPLHLARPLWYRTAVYMEMYLQVPFLLAATYAFYHRTTRANRVCVRLWRVGAHLVPPTCSQGATGSVCRV